MKNEIIRIVTCDKNDGFQHLGSKFHEILFHWKKYYLMKKLIVR
jgi:hypothetical protein